MERQDLDLIACLTPAHPELGDLMAEHHELERRLTRFVEAKWLSSEDDAKQRKLKRLKLVGRDRIESILADHRRVQPKA